MVLSSSSKDTNSKDEVTLEEQRKEVGALLKAARVERNLTVEDVVLVIRIRKLYIEALEKGNFETLPGRAYVIGFIRSYAHHLQLDENELLRRVDLLSISPPKPISLPFRVAIKNQTKAPYIIVILFVTLGLVVFFSLLWSKKFFTTEPTVPSQFNQTTSQKAIEIENLEKKEKFSSAQSNYDSSKENALAVDKASIGNSFNESPMPLKSLSNLSQFSSETSSVKQESEALLTSSSSERFLEPALKNQIELQALEDTWVQILSPSGNILYMKVMKSGDYYKTSGNEKAILNTGNAGGLQLIVDGESFASLGSKGEVIKGLALNSDTIKSFYEKKLYSSKQN